MLELLVRDRTTRAGWQICSKLNRIKHCYDTRTKPHSPDARTRLRQAAPVTLVRGRQPRTVKACKSRRLNRAERRSCDGMNSVLGNRVSSTVQSFRMRTIALAHRSTTQYCETWCSSWIVGLVFFSVTSESQSLQQGKTLTRSLSPGKIPIGIRSLSFHNVLKSAFRRPICVS
jgi:hypothetical protein